MRDCENCKHRVMKVEVGKGTPPEHFWGCECWECEFEPTTKNDLGVDREDAVERLNALKQLIGYDKDSEIVKATQKSLDMAIKALEQEPTTKNDLGVDLISRADVLKLMQDNWHTHNGDWAMQESMDDIRALPSVTPQEPCDKCEVGNPCLYCKHEFEPQESEDKE